MNPKTIGAFVCVAIGCTTVAAARDLTEHSTSQQTIRFAQGAGRTLDVRTIQGAITVEAYDGRDVEITVNKSISASSQEDLRDAERDVVLDQSDTDGLMKAIVRYPDQPACGERGDRNRRRSWHEPPYDVRYDFTIRVPRDTRLELCTVNEGNIVVKGAQGDFVLRTVNGRINMTDMGGSGQATTVNGGVTASFVRAPRTPSTFKTINGDVIVTMPDGLAADLRMKTFNGGLFTDFDVQTLPSATPVMSEQRDGMFIYRSPGFTTVRAGGGGPELTLDTLNGDVRVLKRSK
jgi:hypothetical protein